MHKSVRNSGIILEHYFMPLSKDVLQERREFTRNKQGGTIVFERAIFCREGESEKVIDIIVDSLCVNTPCDFAIRLGQVR